MYKKSRKKNFFYRGQKKQFYVYFCHHSYRKFSDFNGNNNISDFNENLKITPGYKKNKTKFTSKMIFLVYFWHPRCLLYSGMKPITWRKYLLFSRKHNLKRNKEMDALHDE